MSIVSYLKKQVRHDWNTRKRLENIDSSISRLQQEQNKLFVQQRIYDMQDKVMNCTLPGVTSDPLCGEEVIVSLTTFGKRIYDVYLAIESIMQNTVKPNRILLWLAEEEFQHTPLPQTLLKQQKRGLEIRYCPDIRSYKKIIPTLQAFPESTIITIDDDAIYEFDLIERMINAHINNPKAVCSCRTHRINLNEEGRPNSYLDWEMCASYEDTSYLNFPTTGGGTLYPPNSLHKEVTNIEAFTSMCPTADDIWLHAMAVMNDTPIMHVDTPKPEGYYLPTPSSNFNALCDINTSTHNCQNDIQIEKLYNHYHLYEKIK